MIKGRKNGKHREGTQTNKNKEKLRKNHWNILCQTTERKRVKRKLFHVKQHMTAVSTMKGA